MASANDFLPFATGAGANVTSQAAWLASATRPTGFVSGLAASADANKALRQAAFVSSTFAQFVADILGAAVQDNGNQATFESQISAAISAIATGEAGGVSGRFNGIYASATAGSSLYTPQPTTSTLVIQMVGGGGGGGGCTSPAAGNASVAQGGDAGTYGVASYACGRNSAPLLVTIGTGGAAGLPAGNGGTGGTTAFAGVLSVGGGLGGSAAPTLVAPFDQGDNGRGYGSRFSGPFSYVVLGMTGFPGLALAAGQDAVFGGFGGSNPLGTGGQCAGTAAGLPGLDYGSGGSGASAPPGYGPFLGGNGAQGVIFITEFT